MPTSMVLLGELVETVISKYAIEKQRITVEHAVIQSKKCMCRSVVPKDLHTRIVLSTAYLIVDRYECFAA